MYSGPTRQTRFLALVLALTLGFLGLLTIGAAPAEAKTATIRQINIQAEVLPDGSLQVQEQRTFDFSGSFSWAEQTINFGKAADIVDVELYDGSQQLQPGGAGQPGHYTLDRRSDSIYLRWYYSAQNEQRTFTVRYRVLEVVQVHTDVAELYWQFIGDGWDLGADRVQAEVILPTGATREEVRAWGHGPLTGRVDIISGSKVQWAVDGLEPNTMVEGRVTFPPRLVPNARTRTGEAKLDQIIAEETRWAQRANLTRGLYRYQPYLALGILLLAGLGVFLLQLKYGREYSTDFDAEYLREPPDEYSPAVLGYLWEFGSISPSEVISVIVDLVYRDYVEIQPFTEEEPVFFGLLGSRTDTDYFYRAGSKDPSELAEFEQLVYELLFYTADVAEAEGWRSFEEFQNWVSNNASDVREWFRDFESELDEVVDEYEFIEGRNWRGLVIGILGGIALVVGGITLIYNELFLMGPAAMLAGIGLFITPAFLRRRTQAGAEELAEWQAFKRYLEDFGSLDDETLPSLAIWEHYLVYAVPLGVADLVLEQLKMTYPQFEESSQQWRLGWMAYGTTGAGTDLEFGSFAGALSNSMSTAISPSSSGSGGGGGFSGGGGGGSGGGGGGVG